MSSNPSAWRQVLSFLDKHPAVESTLEVLFTTVVTFLPMIIAALLSMSKDQFFVFDKLKNNFYSYFTAGELILIVLSTCGSVIWLYIFKIKDGSIFVRFIVSVVIFVAAITFSGGILGNNPGFSVEYPRWVLFIIFCAYALSLAFWLYASIAAKSDGTTTLDDEAVRADELIRRARR